MGKIIHIKIYRMTYILTFNVLIFEWEPHNWMCEVCEASVS